LHGGSADPGVSASGCVALDLHVFDAAVLALQNAFGEHRDGVGGFADGVRSGLDYCPAEHDFRRRPRPEHHSTGVHSAPDTDPADSWKWKEPGPADLRGGP